MSTGFPSDFIDKNGTQIHEDDVITDGNAYYRIYWNEKQPQVEAISCTHGYLHNLSQKDLAQFERIGSYAENEHLLECD